MQPIGPAFLRRGKLFVLVRFWKESVRDHCHPDSGAVLARSFFYRWHVRELDAAKIAGLETVEVTGLGLLGLQKAQQVLFARGRGGVGDAPQACGQAPGDQGNGPLGNR